MSLQDLSEDGRRAHARIESLGHRVDVSARDGESIATVYALSGKFVCRENAPGDPNMALGMALASLGRILRVGR